VPESQSRRLAAILAADIAGYSALMGSDEARTVRDLKGHQAVVLPMVGDFGGRIIDTAGDGILAEFPSIVNAVECAVAIQRRMAERNAAIEPERRIEFRIGINFGDVIYDDARIFGDSINVAARLEVIAEPGGICVSSKVYEEIRGKIDSVYDDLGERQLKNIAQPVRVYGIRLDGAPARPALGLPDIPSIAVLPFTNLSGDRARTGSPRTSPPPCRNLAGASSSLAIRPSSTRAGRSMCGRSPGNYYRRALRSRGQRASSWPAHPYHGSAH